MQTHTCARAHTHIHTHKYTHTTLSPSQPLPPHTHTYVRINYVSDFGNCVDVDDQGIEVDDDVVVVADHATNVAVQIHVLSIDSINEQSMVSKNSPW